MDRIKVIVCGVNGNMGKHVVRSVLSQKDMELVGGIDIKGVGKPIEGTNIIAKEDLSLEIREKKSHVLVDFTKGDVSAKHILTALEEGVFCVVGTTGIPDEDIEKIRQKAEEKGLGVLIAPNFSIGAVLMMQFAKEAAKYYQWAEIIELHHEKKADAPSGTALRTAKLMGEVKEFKTTDKERIKLDGVRGGIWKGIRIHSVRMPGLLAHQEVKLGSLGETLTIKHDSLSRECFMAGVMMAIRKIRHIKGLVVGLENIMNEG